MSAPREFDARCERIAGIVAAEFHLPRLDREDVLQEARVGVWRSLADYRPEAGVPWEPFARMVCRRHLMTCVTTANRIGRRAQNEAASLNAPIDEQGTELAEVALGRAPSAHEQAATREEVRDVLAGIARLSEIEREAVVRAAIAGEAYETVGETKRVDNALQRARRKLAVAPPAPESRSGVLLVCRELHPTERDAIREARRVVPGCQVGAVRKRKVRAGRVVAPQGRPARDGSLGRPVWAVEVVA